MVASVDRVASQIGGLIFDRGGNAVDAAIATNAALAVTAPHMCGMGGDLFALVHTGSEVVALNASGRAGSGANPDALRAGGHDRMPFHHHIESVTVPGCVDGWIALHDRFGSLPLAELLMPAITLANEGFGASPVLAGALAQVDDRGRAALGTLGRVSRAGEIVVRPGVGRTLAAIANHGAEAFYGGEFGDGLRALGQGLFSADDLMTNHAQWVAPLTVSVFGLDLHTIGPNSQGYLLAGSALIADQIGLPDDPDDPAWAHLLVEAARLAGYDRPDVLHDGASGADLVASIAGRASQFDADHAGDRTAPGNDGDTTYLCTAQADQMAVSLIQSNAAGFGSWLVEPTTGINLHNRGIGFSLQPGHIAELAPGRRPPHTLAPAMATADGAHIASFGTMGGDAQPQILLQLAARLFVHHQSPGDAVRAPRWRLAGPATGFDTWDEVDRQVIKIEGHAPTRWVDGLTARGHRVDTVADLDHGFGHAHAIISEPDGSLAGAADPRSIIGAVAAR